MYCVSFDHKLFWSAKIKEIKSKFYRQVKLTVEGQKIFFVSPV